GGSGGGDARGGHEHRFILHAHLGQRHLQRRAGAIPQVGLVRTPGTAGQPGDHCVDWRVPAVLRTLVSAQGRPLDLPGCHRDNLPVEHDRAADRLLLLAPREQLGCSRGHRLRRGRADLLSDYRTVPENEARRGNNRTVLFRHRDLSVGRCGNGGRFLSETAGGTRSSIRRLNQNSMLSEHWFWLLLTMVALVWYSTVTVYVAVRGTFDIRQMLRRLRD